MKAPFHEQVTQFDCVPTTFLNAYSYLFDRNAIPAEVVLKTYLYSLDAKGGTTTLAVKMLANWLSEFRHKSFGLTTEFNEGKQVHLRSGSPIAQCLERSGVALIKVTDQGSKTDKPFFHYILGLSIEDGWINCFDPHPRTTKSNKLGQYEFMPQKGCQSPNLRIACAWMDARFKGGQFQFGPLMDRECLLLESA